MKLSRSSSLLAAVAIMMTTTASGQPPSTAKAPPPPWASFHLDRKVRVKLDFRNASIDAVLHALSQASGVTIIIDPALTGGITLQSPKMQSLSEAFAMLNAVLTLKHYEMDKQGDFLVVQAAQPAGAAPAASGQPGMPGQPSMPGQPGMPGGARPMGAPGQPTMPGQPGAHVTVGAAGRHGRGGRVIPGAPPMPGGMPPGASGDKELQVYVIKYASATEVARVINEVFAPAAPPQQQPGMPVFMPPGQPSGNAAGGPTVKASAEDYSNAIIVKAPAKEQGEIATIIAQIDKAQDQPEQPRVFKLQFAQASDLQPVIENILTGSAPLGRGGPTTSGNKNNNSFPFFIFGAQPPANNDGGTVVADSRTNSLIVTATVENLDHVSDVIKQLDQPATYQSTTFVYTLKNARADVVANLLNQSFGNRTNNGPVGGSLTNTGLSQSLSNQGNNNNNNPAGNTQPASLNNNQNQNQNQNPNNNQSFGTGGIFNQTGQNAPTTGLDSEGHVVNVRSLMNQVLLVPNIDTNSLIVVAPPEDRKLVEDILKQMDEVPKQVMIETLVVEANLTRGEQLGLEYNFSVNNPSGIHGIGTASQSYGLQSNTTQPEGFRYTLTAAQYQIFLQAVQTSTKFNVLSTPRIFTTNNATAQINISQSLPYVTNQTVETTGTVLYNYNFLDVGIVLTVTPRITDNGQVIMDVTQTANDFVDYTSFNAPIVNQRETETTVNVADGHTVVIGGIINDQVTDTVNKVPLLGDIPLLGNLFRSSNKQRVKTELLVFLTPHIVNSPSDAEQLREQTEAELGKTTQQMIPAAIKPSGTTTTPAAAAPGPLSPAAPAKPSTVGN